MEHTEQTKSWQEELAEAIQQVPAERAPEARAFIIGYLNGLKNPEKKAV